MGSHKCYAEKNSQQLNIKHISIIQRKTERAEVNVVLIAFDIFDVCLWNDRIRKKNTTIIFRTFQLIRVYYFIILHRDFRCVLCALWICWHIYTKWFFFRQFFCQFHFVGCKLQSVIRVHNFHRCFSFSLSFSDIFIAMAIMYFLHHCFIVMYGSKSQRRWTVKVNLLVRKIICSA